MHVFNPTKAAIAAVALLSALPGSQAAGLYPKSSSVLQVDAKSYDKLIAKSNQTSIVEFYAPWCGHCKNLQPAYEKAAKHLEGLAKVAAVNCDEDENKQFCGAMGVQGFPTLKTVRPGKSKGSKPIVEDYQGPRTAKGIADAVTDKINNHVKRVTDKDVDEFVSNNPESPKAILFTEKGTTSALLKSIAIDFLSVIPVAQIRNKETKANEMFGIESYPTLVLLPGDGKEPIVYDGEMKKGPMVKFLSQAGEPNPDPAPAKSKSKSKKDEAPPPPPPKAESEAEEPVAPKSAPAIPAITGTAELQKECLNTKAHTCVLVLVPKNTEETAEKALSSLAEISAKYAQLQQKLFPSYKVPLAEIMGSSLVMSKMGLSGSDVQIVAVNGKRGWWRQYEGDFTVTSVEDWIDAIRMGDGAKNKLPSGLLQEPAAGGHDEL